MLRYTIILLLVNTYGRSLGGPVPQPNNNGKILIGNLLSELSKQCKNKFILSQIEAKNTTCNVEVNYNVLDLQCLMFYDANRLLCNLTLHGENSATDFTTKISEKQNASAFCSEASRFAVPSTDYKEFLTTVFQNADGCKRVCTDDDIRTPDTNFFCKYYKWALQMVQIAQISPHVSATIVGSEVPSEIHKVDATTVHLVQSSNGQVNGTSDTAAGAIASSLKAEDSHHHTAEVSRPESSPTAQLSAGVLTPEKGKIPTDLNITKKSTINPIQNVPAQSVVVQNEETREKTVDADTVDVAGDAGDAGDLNDIGVEPSIDINAGMNTGANKDLDASIQQIETPKHKIGPENDDSEDSVVDAADPDDEDKETGDDADDPVAPDFQVNIQNGRNTNKRVEPQVSLSGDSTQKDFFQNPDGFTEDDDHFFPFFLSGVIIVVILYVLYHNKNKVGKMFFGLIVEGRQGRRRNSRGHAYRRLDTLEQAMSAGAPAPPSKIIY